MEHGPQGLGMGLMEAPDLSAPLKEQENKATKFRLFKIFHIYVNLGTRLQQQSIVIYIERNIKKKKKKKKEERTNIYLSLFIRHKKPFTYCV